MIPPPFKIAIVPVTPLQQNCSLIFDPQTKAIVVVDAGGDVGRIETAAKKLGGEIKELWLTHGHLDHAGGAAELKRRTGAPIIGPHRDDLFWLEGIPEHAAMYGLSGLEACVPDRWLEDGETLRFAGADFDVVHCPGHTPGHVVFVARDAKVAFVGDVIFQGSIGRTDFPRGNHADLIASITEKLWPYGDDITFIPGHGATSTFGAERRSNPFVADAVLAQG